MEGVVTRPCLTRIITRGARIRPSATCLVAGDRRTTYAELLDHVAGGARALADLGIRDGARVAMLAGNSDRLIEAIFASVWAGGVATPLNTRWSPAEIAAAVIDSGAEVLLVDAGFTDIAAELLEFAPALRAVRRLDDDRAPGAQCLPTAATATRPLPDAGRAGDDAALLLYTGGTTGAPKGVLLSHANLLSATMGMLAAGCGTGETYLHVPPLFHIAGIQVMLGHFLGSGGRHVVIPGFDPPAVLTAIAMHRVTDVMLVPAMLHLLLAHPGFATSDVTSLRRIFYGAAPMSAALLSQASEAMPHVGFVQGYGMTESALTVMLPPSFYTPAGRGLAKTGSIGRPLPEVELAILNPAGRECPAGEVGELTVRSPSVMLGYHGQPELSAATVRDGWLHTGDGAFLDSDGFVFLVDRIKDMIITGGENVYSVEVENVLAGHPGVAMAAVIGVPDPLWGERVHAVVSRAPGADVTADELIAYCRARLTAFKAPRSVEVSEGLPVSAAGKVQKARLRAEHGLASGLPA